MRWFFPLFPLKRHNNTGNKQLFAAVHGCDLICPRHPLQSGNYVATPAIDRYEPADLLGLLELYD